MAGIVFGWAPPGAATRASDAERERAARALRRHYAAGRLTLAELDERLERAWAARSRGDLARLFADLPSDRGGRLLRRFARLQRRLLAVHAAGYAGVNGTLVGVWALTGGDFWPAWSLLPGTTVLAWHAGGTYLLTRAAAARRA